MARTGITYHEVANAIATLQGRQKNPTIDTIREELGTGSKSTIAKYFTDWKSKNGVTNTNEMGIPNELQQLIRGLWEKIQADADIKIEKHQVEADAKINDAKNTVALIQQKNSLLHTEIKTLTEKCDHQTQISDQLKNSINNLENEKTKLVERISSLEAHNLDHKNENDRLHTLLKNTQNNLVHYQNAVEQQRQEQALLSDKQRVKYELKLSELQNQLSNTLNEKTEYQTKHDGLLQKHNQLLTDFETEKNNIQLLQRDCHLLSIENNQLKNEAEKLSTLQYQLIEKLETKNNENTELHIQLKASESSNLSKKNMLDKLEHRMQLLKEQFDKTAHEKAFLEGQLKQLQLTKQMEVSG